MCGIVGYLGPSQAAPVLISELRCLEYRGYDSAGVAVIEEGKLAVLKAAGKLANLELGQQAVADEDRRLFVAVENGRQALTACVIPCRVR